jgi:hypothetical protein
MARTQNLTDLAEIVRWARLAVSAAIPLPFATAGIVEAEPSPETEHALNLRELAFPAVLQELLETEYGAVPADLTALEQGRIPVADYEEQQA